MPVYVALAHVEEVIGQRNEAATTGHADRNVLPNYGGDEEESRHNDDGDSH